MKREILFKGKRVDNGQWIEGFFYSDPEDGFFIQDFEYILDNGNNFDEPPHGYFKRVYAQVHPETVCQFVTDDLFEGDIIERPENHKCTGEDLSIGKYQVVYDSDNLRYGLKTIKSEIFKEGSIVGFHGKLTKIGNIHDETH